MERTFLFALLPLALAAAPACAAASGGDGGGNAPCTMAAGEMSAAEVRELLPKGPDVDDDREIANYRKLVARGESICGVLLDIVRTEDTLVASRALGVLCESRGDKRAVVAELGKVLEEKRFRTGRKDELMLMLLAKAISDMGEESDGQLLVPLFSHPSEDVRGAARHFAARLEGKGGGPDAPAGEEESPAQAAKTYRDYPEWEIFPKGMDSEDDAEAMKYRCLAERGESAHAALMAIVRECDDSMFVGRALSILIESQGDKRAVVAELKKLFAQRLPDAEDEWEIYYMANAIAEMGGEEDSEVLIPMLKHPGWIVRVNGARFLGRIGGAKALEALKEARQQAQDRNPTEREAVEQAIAAVEKRLAEKGE